MHISIQEIYTPGSNLCSDGSLQEGFPASVVTHLHCGVSRVKDQVKLPECKDKLKRINSGDSVVVKY